MGIVLIVDSDLGFAEALEQGLGDLGHEVHILEDVQLSELRRIRPDVLVVSVELGDNHFRGFSLCSRIRRDKELSGLGIILTSGELKEEAFKKHAESSDRADDYAIKPVSVGDLVGRITRLLDADGPKTATVPPWAQSRDQSEENTFEEGTLDPRDHPALEAMEEDSESRTPAPSDEGRAVPPPLPSRSSTSPTSTPPGLHLSSLEAASVEVGALWPAHRFDEAMRDATGIAEPQPPSKRKPTPEERVAYLRELVNFHKAKDTAVQNVWRALQDRGVDLERRVISLENERLLKEQLVRELTQGREEAIRAREAVEQNFRDFDNQVRSIFAEKDVEQRSLLEERDHLAASLSEKTSQLEATQSRLAEEARKLELIQEDLEALSIARDEAQGELEGASILKEQAVSELFEARARLEMTEAVAAERAEEVSQLRDQLDSLAIEGDAKLRRLEQAHKDEMAAVHARHADTLVAMQTEHESVLEALESSHALEMSALKAHHEEILSEERAQSAREKDVLVRAIEELESRLEEDRETLLAEHAAELDRIERAQGEEIARLEGQRADALEMAEREERRADDLAQRLADTESSLSQEIGALRADIATLEERQEASTESLEEAERRLSGLSRRNRELEEQVADLTDNLGLNRKRLEENEETLEEERNTHADLVERLEHELVTTRGELAARIQALEEQLEAAQAELVEKLADLDHERQSSKAHETRAQDLETSRKLTERSLRSAEAQVSTLVRQIGELERTQAEAAELAKKESQLRTEAEASESVRAEELRTTLAEKEGLERQLRELEAELESVQEEAERSSRYAESQARLREAEIDRLKAELIRRTEHLAEEIGRRDRDLAALAEQMHADKSAQSNELEAKVQELEAKTVEVVTLRSQVERSLESVDAARAAAHELAARLEATEDEVESLRRQVATLEIEAASTGNELQTATRHAGEQKRRTEDLERALNQKAQEIMRLEMDRGDLKATAEEQEARIAALERQSKEQSEALLEGRATVGRALRALHVSARLLGGESQLEGEVRAGAVRDDAVASGPSKRQPEISAPPSRPARPVPNPVTSPAPTPTTPPQPRTDATRAGPGEPISSGSPSGRQVSPRSKRDGGGHGEPGPSDRSNDGFAYTRRSGAARSLAAEGQRELRRDTPVAPSVGGAFIVEDPSIADTGVDDRENLSLTLEELAENEAPSYSDRPFAALVAELQAAAGSKGLVGTVDLLPREDEEPDAPHNERNSVESGAAAGVLNLAADLRPGREDNERQITEIMSVQRLKEKPR